MLPGGLKLSEGGSKVGAAVWGKICSSEVRRQVPKGTAQGRWQGIQGLPWRPAVSQGSELTAAGRRVGGQQRFGSSKLIQCRVLAGKARFVGTGWEAMPEHPVPENSQQRVPELVIWEKYCLWKVQNTGLGIFFF